MFPLLVRDRITLANQGMFDLATKDHRERHSLEGHEPKAKANPNAVHYDVLQHIGYDGVHPRLNLSL